MIQRIQTVFLALSLMLLGLIGSMGFADIAVGAEVYEYSVQGISKTGTDVMLVKGWPVLGLWVIVVLLQVVAIFGFKKRVLQMRIATISLLLMIGLVGASFLFARMSITELGDDATVSYGLGMILPIAAAILNYLAIRAIGKDEALVRSLDRLR